MLPQPPPTTSHSPSTSFEAISIKNSHEEVVKDEEVSVVKQSYKRSMWAAEAVAADLQELDSPPRPPLQHHHQRQACATSSAKHAQSA